MPYADCLLAVLRPPVLATVRRLVLFRYCAPASRVVSFVLWGVANRETPFPCGVWHGLFLSFGACVCRDVALVSLRVASWLAAVVFLLAGVWPRHRCRIAYRSSAGTAASPFCHCAPVRSVAQWQRVAQSRETPRERERQQPWLPESSQRKKPSSNEKTRPRMACRQSSQQQTQSGRRRTRQTKAVGTAASATAALTVPTAPTVKTAPTAPTAPTVNTAPTVPTATTVRTATTATTATTASAVLIAPTVMAARAAPTATTVKTAKA